MCCNGILQLSCALLRMTTAEPDPPETGTIGRSSRARNILRRLQRFASERLCECCARSGPADLFRCPPESALHRAVRSPRNQLCFVAKIRDGFDPVARKIDPAAAD